MKRVRIEVTAQDIRRGKKADPDHCPVARALRRAGLPKAWAGDSHYGWGEETASWPLPKRAKRFIEAFDNGMPVRPFSAVVPGRGRKAGL